MSETSATCLVVLDDDPTGIQTVHDNLLLTRWDRDGIRRGLEDDIGFFYVCTNTRARSSGEAERLVYELAASILEVNREVGKRLVFMSRSDSTLRSHFPLEVDAVRRAIQEAGDGDVDAVLVVPAFIEGNRITENDTHFLIVDGKKVATSETEFARDQVFGYRSSHLPTYIEEKTRGRVRAESVESISLALIRGPAEGLEKRLSSLSGGTFVCVNATSYDDLRRFAAAVRSVVGGGKRFAFQCAASIVKALSEVPDIALLDGGIRTSDGPGLVVAGSHVGLTTKQLDAVKDRSDVAFIEVDVRRVLEDPDASLDDVRVRISDVTGSGQTPLVFTSRSELKFGDTDARLAAGEKISGFLCAVVRALDYSPSFVIAKGGITSYDLLTHGIGVSACRVLGQIAPGIPVVRVPESRSSTAVLPGTPYIIFPGNVGNERSLAAMLDLLLGNATARTTP